MATFGGLIESIRGALSGYDASKDAVAALVSPITALDTEFVIDDLTAAARGVAEIGLEVVRVKQVNPQNSNVLLYPFGRGYRGSTAAPHPGGTEVRFNPQFAAHALANEINGTIGELYPSIYAVRTVEMAYPDGGGALTVDDESVGVISVWVEDPSRVDQWVRDDRWDFNPDSTSIAAGLRMGRDYRGGRIRVVYATQPGHFDMSGSMAQDFRSVTGLPARCADLLTLGVAYRMAPMMDIGRLGTLSAAARDAGTKRTGDGATVARLVYSMFQSRLDQEALVLAREHPIRIHSVR